MELQPLLKACATQLRHQWLLALLCLLCLSRLPQARALRVAADRPYDRSDFYAALLRAVDDRQIELEPRVVDALRHSDLSAPLHTLRVRRKAADKRAELLAYDKKSYPRICYFSPIQCLFTRMSLK